MVAGLIETLLSRIGHREGQTLHLEAGAPVRLDNGSGQARNLTSRLFTREEIVAALVPLLPAGVQAGAEALPVEFRYQCAGVGEFRVRIQNDDRALLVAIDTAVAGEPDPPPPAAVTPPPEPVFAVPALAPSIQPTPVDASAIAIDRPAIDQLLRLMFDRGASDLHLCVGMPPLVRKDGEMQPLAQNAPPLGPEDLVALIEPIMPERNREEFARRHDTDFAYDIPQLARFRANAFMDRKGRGGVFRVIPSKILTAEELGLSPHILQLCRLNKGLVLVTGPTGSGKSTTLCAMVDYVNRNRTDHIITIEDPIEFVHDNKRCLVNQREVHTHTDSFKDALRAALREDPDILLVGEMRDLETVAIAIETAETGHLVFGTLHTTTAASTVDRIIDQFPTDRQSQIRVMLSESLRGVISQTLCRKIGGGRIAALEVLIVTSAVSNLIREGKTFQIPSIMQVGKSFGMVALNESLMALVSKKLVAPEEAYVKAVDKTSFEGLLKRAGIDTAFTMTGGPA